MEDEQVVPATTGSGIVGKVIDWTYHAGYSQGSPSLWIGGLVFVIILSFLWSTVVKQLVD